MERDRARADRREVIVSGAEEKYLEVSDLAAEAEGLLSNRLHQMLQGTHDVDNDANLTVNRQNRVRKALDWPAVRFPTVLEARSPSIQSYDSEMSDEQVLQKVTQLLDLAPQTLSPEQLQRLTKGLCKDEATADEMYKRCVESTHMEDDDIESRQANAMSLVPEESVLDRHFIESQLQTANDAEEKSEHELVSLSSGSKTGATYTGQSRPVSLEKERTDVAMQAVEHHAEVIASHDQLARANKRAATSIVVASLFGDDHAQVKEPAEDAEGDATALLAMTQELAGAPGKSTALDDAVEPVHS